jgi:hypothetical protein
MRAVLQRTVNPTIPGGEPSWRGCSLGVHGIVPSMDLCAVGRRWVRNGFLAVSQILTGQSLDTVQATRLYDALVTDDAREPGRDDFARQCRQPAKK